MKRKLPNRKGSNDLLMYEGLALCVAIIILSIAVIIMNMC